MKNNLDNNLIPADPLEKRGMLFTYDIENRIAESIKFVRNGYENRDAFQAALGFVDYVYLDAVKSGFKELEKVGFFPATEAQMEFDQSLKHALIGSYKAAYGYLRRALELTTVYAYLISEKVERKKAVDWLKSKENTPFFSGMLKSLIKESRFKSLNDGYNWESKLKTLYGKISDFTHVKGISKGFRELNNTNRFFAYTSAPNISLTSLKEYLDTFIETVGNVSTIIALRNPIVLVGLPLDEKFGINTPMGGYLYEGQAELVNKVIPDDYRDYFANIKREDEEVLGIIQWFHDMPNISEE